MVDYLDSFEKHIKHNAIEFTKWYLLNSKVYKSTVEDKEPKEIDIKPIIDLLCGELVAHGNEHYEEYSNERFKGI